MLDSIFYRISKSEIIVIAIGLLSLLGQVLFFRTLDLPILQSDPYLYLLQSRQWWVEDLHLPGYAFILWLVNKLSFACLPDALLLHLVAATTWLVSILTFIKITKILEIEEKIRVFLLLIYAFFPLIGLTFAAWPLSDSSVCLLVNLLVIACLKKKLGTVNCGSSLWPCPSQNYLGVLQSNCNICGDRVGISLWLCDY